MQELKDAIAAGHITLYYQPIIDLATGCIAGYEALSRWEREGEVWLPARFIDDIIGTGLERAWFESQITALQSAYAVVDAGQFLSLNLSRESLAWADLLGVVAGGGIAHDRLWLEVPESVDLRDDSTEARSLKILRRAGFPLEIDDFGVREAGFRRFLTGLFNGVKLDHRIIKGCSQDVNRRALIAAMVGLCAQLGLTLVAEGIDNPWDADCCRDLGVGLAQGFYFGRPKPLPGNLGAAIEGAP